MAIKQETITVSGMQYLYTWSDAYMLIRQEETGQLYTDAQDVIPCQYTYTETDIPIDPETIPTPTPSPDPYAEAGRILLGAE